MSMRIVAISDMHGHLPEKMPVCDLLLVGGDICPVWNHDRKYQAIWLREEFNYWIRTAPAKNVVWIGGNHDFVLEDAGAKLHDQMLGTYLKDSLTEVNGLKIWGSPWSNQFGNWAFMREEDKLSHIYKQIPRDIDILITHGPPHGLGDLIPSVTWDSSKRGWDINGGGDHVGSTSLINQLSFDEWPNLKLVITGHIHEAYGKYELGDVGIYNASLMDGAYNPVNPVWEIEL